jgi:hypothetical protein
MSGYTHVQDGRTLEVFRVLTLREPGCAGISMGRDQFVHVDAPKVEEVCAALREAAGLRPVWTVEKTSLDDDYDVTVREDGDVRDEGANKLTPTAARLHAAQLLAAADEAEARANRPKLPTAFQSVVKLGHEVWIRGSDRWTSPLPERHRHAEASDEWMARQDFTVLYDPEAEGGA